MPFSRKLWALAAVLAACAFGQTAQAVRRPRVRSPASRARQPLGVAQLEPLREVEIRPRIGILGETRIRFAGGHRAGAGQRSGSGVSRIAARGGRLQRALGAGRLRSGDGSAGLSHQAGECRWPRCWAEPRTGKLTKQELNATPQVERRVSRAGRHLRPQLRQLAADHATAVQHPEPAISHASSASTSTQPLWRGLRFDENRHRLQVARQNQQAHRCSNCGSG